MKSPQNNHRLRDRGHLLPQSRHFPLKAGLDQAAGQVERRPPEYARREEVDGKDVELNALPIHNRVQEGPAAGGTEPLVAEDGQFAEQPGRSDGRFEYLIGVKRR